MANENILDSALRRVESVAKDVAGPLLHAAWKVGSYFAVNITVSLFWFYFFVLNRTTVIGRENVGDERNTLLLSNHQSMIDSFLVGLVAYYPRSWIKPHLIPWNPAAEENFFRPRPLGLLARLWKCIPVREGRRDPRALHRIIEVLPDGVMTIFPEGTRSRTGKVGRGRPGPGFIVLATHPRVIPVAIEGMQEVLPIGEWRPRFFKRIYIQYGEAIDYSEFLDRPRVRETAQALIEKVMEAIRAQHAELKRLRAREKGKAGPGTEAA